MWAPQWLVRDSNWFPDFPTSAKIAQGMIARDRGVETDGVIAVDMRLLPRLVAAMENLELGGETLAGENVIAILKARWKPLPPGDMSPAWFVSDRKNALGELFQALVLSVRAGELHPGALAQALSQGLRDKSVQLFINDAQAEQAVLDAGWGGALEPGPGDYLFVVDSNVGFNKVNAQVYRSIAYTVFLDRPRPEAVVEIEYANPSRAAPGACDLHAQHKDNTYASMEESCYWNYVRVLTPRDTQLVAAEGVSDAESLEETGAAAVFGGYAVIPRDSTQVVRFTYALPARVLRDEAYTLAIQLQAGADPTPLTVRVHLPPGRRVRSATHALSSLDHNVVETQFVLGRDTNLGLQFSPLQ
jgi:hypothetical protein